MTTTTGPANADDRQNAIRGLNDAIRRVDAAMAAVYRAMVELNRRGDAGIAKTLDAFDVAAWAVSQLGRSTPDPVDGSEPPSPPAVTAADLTAIMKAKGLID